MFYHEWFGNTTELVNMAYLTNQHNAVSDNDCDYFLMQYAKMSHCLPVISLPLVKQSKGKFLYSAVSSP